MTHIMMSKFILTKGQTGYDTKQQLPQYTELSVFSLYIEKKYLHSMNK